MEAEPETFLVKTILEVTDMSDADLKAEYLSLRRRQRMGKLKENDVTRFLFIEKEREARKGELEY